MSNVKDYEFESYKHHMTGVVFDLQRRIEDMNDNFENLRNDFQIMKTFHRAMYDTPKVTKQTIGAMIEHDAIDRLLEVYPGKIEAKSETSDGVSHVEYNLRIVIKKEEPDHV